MTKILFSDDFDDSVELPLDNDEFDDPFVHIPEDEPNRLTGVRELVFE